MTSKGRGGVVRMAFMAVMLPAASDNGCTDPRQLTPHGFPVPSGGPEDEREGTTAAVGSKMDLRAVVNRAGACVQAGAVHGEGGRSYAVRGKRDQVARKPRCVSLQ